MVVLKVNYDINKCNENLMALTEQHITQDCKYFKNLCFLCTPHDVVCNVIYTV